MRDSLKKFFQKGNDQVAQIYTDQCNEIDKLKSQLAQANERLEKLVDLCDEACLDQIAGDDESTLKPLDDAKQFLKELTIAKSEGK